METRTCRVGVHGRNDLFWTEQDFQLVQEAKIETVKMMSFTDLSVFERLRNENPDLEFIVRLHDDRIKAGFHPSPPEFASKFITRMKELWPFATKFEVHNEPNHPARYEGWGQERFDARDFNDWFMEVYDWLKQAHPWADLGFPGLAVPHRDLEWLDICAPAIEKADFLCAHCYWQTPPDQLDNYLNSMWGMRFKAYHEKFPDKAIHITEFGNSNGQADPPLPLSEDDMACQYVDYYQELFKHDYVGSACAFIASSPDPLWDREGFTWIRNGRLLPVVAAVGAMETRLN